MAMLPRDRIAAVWRGVNLSLVQSFVREMPATFRFVFGPHVTRCAGSLAPNEYSPGGNGPTARVARQSGSGLFRHISRPEIAHAIVCPLTRGSLEIMTSRPVR